MRTLAEIIEARDPLIMAATASVREACEAMRDRRAGAVLVADHRRHPLGIFTGRDAVHRVLAAGKSASGTVLSQVMTAKPTTLAPTCKAIDALRLMRDGGFRHVPVVAGDRLLGIVSRADFAGIEIDRLDEETGLWERL